jgi:ribosomal-protein-alanine N-acetyltransferase
VEFSFRDFRREDFGILWSIDQKCFPPGISYSRVELAAYIRRRGSFTLVAEGAADDEVDLPAGILGFLVANAGRGGTGHIITIDVVPEARRLRVGSSLLGAAEDRLRSAKCLSVFLETGVDNQAALAFYKRHQYDVVKTVPRYYSNGVDAFVLQKDLLSQAEAI